MEPDTPGRGKARPTPYLVVDEATMSRNIDAMAAHVAGVGAALRPHVKTHKCLEIARHQLGAGAAGITVATIGQAEVFAAHGFDDVFIAYPLWGDPPAGRRLAQLARRGHVRVGCDSAAAARELGRNLRGDVGADGGSLRVLVEVDSGMRRTGVPPAQAADVALAARDAGLEVLGVFSFPGHSYSPTGRRDAAEQEREALGVAAAALQEAGLGCPVVSGGSSPSVAFAARGGPITEYRPGVYVVQVAQQWELGVCGPQDVALTAHARVVSHAGGRAVLDAGSKILGADRAGYASGYGRLLDHHDARIVLLSEHHAVCEFPPGQELPPLGSIVRVVPNHACNAINLVDELVVSADGDAQGGTNGGAGVGAWRVAARGANG